MAGLRAEGFVLPTAKVGGADLLDYLVPILEPIATEEFRFCRDWLRGEAVRLGDPRSPAAQLGRQLNLPPSYLLIHRVTLGAVGILCQLGSAGAFRAEMQRWQPGFAPPGSAAAEHALWANRPGRALPALAIETDQERPRPPAAPVVPGPAASAVEHRVPKQPKQPRLPGPPSQRGTAEQDAPATATSGDLAADDLVAGDDDTHTRNPSGTTAESA